MLAATHLVYESNFGVIRFFMAFQMHDLCLKTLCSPVLASFADSKLLDFSRLAIA